MWIWQTQRANTLLAHNYRHCIHDDEVLNDLLDNGSDNSIDDATDKYFNDCGVPQGEVLIPPSFTIPTVNIITEFNNSMASSFV